MQAFLSRPADCCDRNCVPVAMATGAVLMRVFTIPCRPPAIGYRVRATSLNATTRAFSSFPPIPERTLYASVRGIAGL